MTNDSSDEVILVQQNPKANVSNVILQGNSVPMSQPSGIRVTKLSELYLDTLREQILM